MGQIQSQFFFFFFSSQKHLYCIHCHVYRIPILADVGIEGRLLNVVCLFLLDFRRRARKQCTPPPPPSPNPPPSEGFSSAPYRHTRTYMRCPSFLAIDIFNLSSPQSPSSQPVLDPRWFPAGIDLGIKSTSKLSNIPGYGLSSPWR